MPRELPLTHGISKTRDSSLEKTDPGSYLPPVAIQSLLLTLQIPPWAKRRSVKTICMVSGCDITHMIGTSPVDSKQPRRFFWEKRGPGNLRSLVAIQALLLTFQTLPWLKTFCKDHINGLRELEYPFGCHWSDEIQKNQDFFFGKSCSRILQPLSANQALLLTSQTLSWLIDAPKNCFYGFRERQYPCGCHWSDEL